MEFIFLSFLEIVFLLCKNSTLAVMCKVLFTSMLSHMLFKRKKRSAFRNDALSHEVLMLLVRYHDPLADLFS
jgi:hypothetical protein